MAAWRVLPLEVGAPADLLAGGVALLDALAEDAKPTLRWYLADAPAIVLGRGQARLLGPLPDLPIVTRHSGGGAVLLDEGMLSLDVLVPAGHPWLTGDLAAVFDPVGEAWRRALQDLGVPGVSVHAGAGTARRRGDPREQLLASICYATLGRGEVLAGGRKVVGLAQRRRRPGALVQCGLLRRWSPGPLLAAAGADDLAADIRDAAIGLDELLAAPPSVDDLMAAVGAAFAGVGPASQ